MIETPSGVVVDIRRLPREAQVAAFEAGLIPFVPDAVKVEVKAGNASGVLARIGGKG